MLEIPINTVVFHIGWFAVLQMCDMIRSLGIETARDTSANKWGTVEYLGDGGCCWSRGRWWSLVVAGGCWWLAVAAGGCMWLAVAGGTWTKSCFYQSPDLFIKSSSKADIFTSPYHLQWSVSYASYLIHGLLYPSYPTCVLVAIAKLEETSAAALGQHVLPWDVQRWIRCHFRM